MSARPRPQPTPLSQPHWDGCRAGELRVQRCRACGAWQFIPQPLCVRCFSDSVEWATSAGLGVVHSFTVVHRAPHPAFETPYVVAIVTLDEGFEMLANLDCEPARVTVGMRVRVGFRNFDDALALPFFAPA